MPKTQVINPLTSKAQLSPGGKLYDETRKELLNKVGNMEINTGTIITILRFAMEVVEATQLKGPAQRELCIKLVKDIVIAAPLSGEKEKLILDMIDSGVLDNTLELVVDATQGKLDINAAVGVATGCFSAISKNFC
tara:strand:- start:724 stop:1131 length:408 start_codon:yes stop_codon:yes gene_type:complete